MNIVYIDDYINFYSDRLDNILKIIPYKDSIVNGQIIDKEKFIKKLKQVLGKAKLNNNLIGENIMVLTNGLTNVLNKETITEVFHELNYRKVDICNLKSILKIDANTIFVEANKTYYLFYYLDNIGKVKTICLKNDIFLKSFIEIILKELKKKKIIIVGKETMNALNYFKAAKNYYYFENFYNFFIENFLSNKKM